MRSQIIVTTTNNLEGYSIIEYMAPIAANIVIGGNVLSEFSASLTDFFGGRSGTYERKMQQIYDQALASLREKAKGMYADAVLSLRIDMDEISGKGTQIFMISAYGTPVKVKRLATETIKKAVHQAIDGEIVDKKVKAKRIIDNYSKNRRLHPDDASFIVENPYPEFLEAAIGLLISGSQVENYFAQLDQEYIAKALYDAIPAEVAKKYGSQYKIPAVLHSLSIIDYQLVRPLIEDSSIQIAKIGLAIANTGRLIYHQKDIDAMAELVQLIPQRFSMPMPAKTKKAFMGSEKQYWICLCGTDVEAHFDRCAACSSSKFGFKPAELQPETAVGNLQARLDVIRQIAEP